MSTDTYYVSPMENEGVIRLEMQFNSIPWQYLKSNVRQVLNQEQTLEVRLTDGMPDIGRILCAWGQPVLRSKEWRTDGMTITGGISVWVLYVPEDGSGVQSVQAWLPFQGKWSFSDSRREGVICAQCLLRGVDARTLSARKMMVRANIGILAEALEQTQAEIGQCPELPEQVYVYTQTYPICLPVEAGERLLNLEETFSLPERPQRIAACQIRPVVTEENVVGGKVVFRGTAYADLLYAAQDGKLYCQVLELPFAQFADLDRDYDKETSGSVSMAISNLEAEIFDDNVKIKCGLIAQYIVRENRLLQITEDAYSPWRQVTPEVQMLQLPAILDKKQQWIEASQECEENVSQVIHTVFMPDHPTCYRDGDQVWLEFPGVFQVLYYDEDGALQAKTEAWSHTTTLPAADQSNLQMRVVQGQQPNAARQGEGMRLWGQMQLDITTVTNQQIPMVRALEIGQQKTPADNRPALLLQRMGEEGLWNLAKESGSTMDAIRQANGLQGDPVPGQMLLIPVL